jgi:hypothetical protein
MLLTNAFRLVSQALNKANLLRPTNGQLVSCTSLCSLFGGVSGRAGLAAILHSMQEVPARQINCNCFSMGLARREGGAHLWFQ